MPLTCAPHDGRYLPHFAFFTLLKEGDLNAKKRCQRPVVVIDADYSLDTFAFACMCIVSISLFALWAPISLPAAAILDFFKEQTRINLNPA